MILYTVLPMEEVLSEEVLPEGVLPDEPERTLVTARLSGCTLLVEPLGDGRGRVERILSTDPSHYMHPGTQPGSIVYLR